MCQEGKVGSPKVGGQGTAQGIPSILGDIGTRTAAEVRVQHWQRPQPSARGGQWEGWGGEWGRSPGCLHLSDELLLLLANIKCQKEKYQGGGGGGC